MHKNLETKLAKLPTKPGVYFHKDKTGQVIYIGKAANLKNRVRQYFQKSRVRELKTDLLVAEIADVDWVTTESEMDALFLEAELIRRNLPRYNILLRDDKSNVYIRVSYNSSHPTVTLNRRPLDDGARYFGPYWSGREMRQALQFLRHIFPFSTHVGVVPKRACLQYHLGLCPGIEEGKTSLDDYRSNLRKLMRYFQGEKVQLLQQVEKEMKRAARRKDFEAATQARNQLYALRALARQSLFHDSETFDISKDLGLQGLADILGLEAVPRRIEGYDISHMQGTDTVASMVVFKNGIPAKTDYRKFKMRIPGNNDFAHIGEVITRRLSQKNQKAWELPNLFLIDGGKGQLTAAIAARDALGVKRPMIGLAKREEEIIVHRDSLVNVQHDILQNLSAHIADNQEFVSILLPRDSDIVKLAQRIRDESHRFAVSYHSTLKVKRQTVSALDAIPGVGPITRKKLLRTFGSKAGVQQSTHQELAKVVGEATANRIEQHLK